MKYDIWVMPGNHKLKPLLPLYFNDVHALFLTYAVDDLDSFTAIADWDHLYEQAVPISSTSKYLIALKTDVPISERVVTQAMGKQLAREKGYGYYECSAKGSYGSGL